MTTWILPLVQDQASPSRLPLEQDQASPSPGAGPGLPFPVSSGAGPGLPFPRSRTRPLTSLEQDVASPSVPLEQDRTSTSPGAGRGLPVPWSRTMPHPVPFRTAAACWHARIETDDFVVSRSAFQGRFRAKSTLEGGDFCRCRSEWQRHVFTSRSR